MHKTTIATLSLLLATSAIAQAPANSQKQAGQQGGQSAEDSFKTRDANHDNFLSKTEITGSRMADNFTKLDTNKDGKLSLAEYKTGRDAMQGQAGQGATNGNRQQMQGQNVETRFKELDANSDGFVAKTEVSGSRMADRFDAMDSNKDGKLSLNEMKAGSQSGQNGQAPNGNQGMGAAGQKKSST